MLALRANSSKQLRSIAFKGGYFPLGSIGRWVARGAKPIPVRDAGSRGVEAIEVVFVVALVAN